MDTPEMSLAEALESAAAALDITAEWFDGAGLKGTADGCGNDAARARAAAQKCAEKQAHIRELVNRQAEDEGLWFVAQYASEAYLQQELRRLHTAIEEWL